jgi:hypothetical protein
MLHVQLLVIGYTRSKTDPCFYYMHEGTSIAIVGIYVDYLLAIDTSARMMEDLFTSLKNLEVKRPWRGAQIPWHAC